MELRRVAQGRVVRATGSAAIASTNTAGGRLIPIVMVDAAGLPEVKELIRVHQYASDGDCVSQWATVVGKPNVVHLLLEFARPVATRLTVEFRLPELAGAIDNILRAKCMYFMEDEKGVTYMDTQGEPRILIELPSTGFEKAWDRIFHKVIASTMRADGSGRLQSAQRARDFVAQWRKTLSFDE